MLDLQNISFAYEEQLVIRNISFSIPKGTNLALIGESGCGKSTLLKLIYGLYDLNEGHIFFDNEPILGPKFNLVAGMPKMKYLAQDYDLSPYETVAENVGKFLSNMYPEHKKNRVLELLQMVEMENFSNTKAQYLSGGQQQRIALAKSLAQEPEVLLLDEPFSNIDSFRKGALRRNLFAYLKSKNITTIIATHDSTDALSFSDETIAMKAGQIIEHNLSSYVFLKPKNFYVASLFGEVNEVSLRYFNPLSDLNSKILLYPHELYLAEKSDLQVVIKENYFKGNGFLIKAATANKQVIFFENPFLIPINSIVHLEVDNEIINQRSI